MHGGTTLSRCNYCGANLSAKDLGRPDCRYCGTVLPHRAQAAQHAAVMANLLADKNGDGIPDAFEDLVKAAGAKAHVATYRASFVNGKPVSSSYSTSTGHPEELAALFGGKLPFEEVVDAELELQRATAARAKRAAWLAIGISLAITLALVGVAALLSS